MNKSEEKIIKAIRELQKETTNKRVGYLNEIIKKTGIAKPNLTGKYLPLLLAKGVIKKRSQYVVDEVIYKKLK